MTTTWLRRAPTCPPAAAQHRLQEMTVKQEKAEDSTRSRIMELEIESLRGQSQLRALNDSRQMQMDELAVYSTVLSRCVHCFVQMCALFGLASDGLTVGIAERG